MSRVGKMPIAVPKGVDVAITADQITVKGSGGSLTRTLNALVTVKNDAGVEHKVRVYRSTGEVIDIV